VAITAYQRGHLITYWKGKWVYADDKTPANKERPCKFCGEMPTKKGYDPCLGYIPGVKSACCGHGVDEGFIMYDDGRVVMLKCRGRKPMLTNT